MLHVSWLCNQYFRWHAVLVSFLIQSQVSFAIHFIHTVHYTPFDVNAIGFGASPLLRFCSNSSADSEAFSFIATWYATSNASPNVSMISVANSWNQINFKIKKKISVHYGLQLYNLQNGMHKANYSSYSTHIKKNPSVIIIKTEWYMYILPEIQQKMH